MIRGEGFKEAEIRGTVGGLVGKGEGEPALLRGIHERERGVRVFWE